MDPSKILQTDLLDLIFEGRNKDYGAYELRRQYNKRLTKALLITVAFGLLIFLSAFLGYHGNFFFAPVILNTPFLIFYSFSQSSPVWFTYN